MTASKTFEHVSPPGFVHLLLSCLLDMSEATKYNISLIFKVIFVLAPAAQGFFMRIEL